MRHGYHLVSAGCAGIAACFAIVALLEGFNAQWATASGVWMIVSFQAAREARQ